MAYGQNKWKFKIAFWLLSTIFFWFITKHVFYLVRYCVLTCFLFCNGKWKVIDEYWKFGEIKNKNIYPYYFLFCMRELHEVGKSGIFFVSKRFLDLFSALLKAEGAYKLTLFDDTVLQKMHSNLKPRLKRNSWISSCTFFILLWGTVWKIIQSSVCRKCVLIGTFSAYA